MTDATTRRDIPPGLGLLTLVTGVGQGLSWIALNRPPAVEIDHQLGYIGGDSLSRPVLIWRNDEAVWVAGEIDPGAIVLIMPQAWPLNIPLPPEGSYVAA